MNDPGNNVIIKGIVIKSEISGEKSKLLTVLSADLGTIRVLATGGNNSKTSYFGSTQLFSYSQLTLKSLQRGYILSEAEQIESFYPLRQNLRSFALACYFAEICSFISVPGDEQPLRVLLNCLYALIKGISAEEKIKTVFELKTSSAAGFYPNLDQCAVCGSKRSETALFLSIPDGGVLCDACTENAMNAGKGLIPLNGAVFSALYFLRDVDPKKMFSFELGDEDAGALGDIAEKYLMFYLDKEMPSLDFYKRMREI
ncbi:MAG: DNA repair protein RecO [Clostridia bacterium]|nr:DNA repair protein RecO [Clostridia bacterium]